ncbi:17676_t:CDS:2 [Cetraspora pellucida]|uniref:17676_t:CDS:1 n=1 Tax=Cetraspora pellucida TaxID=1433469 RepID=A0ACA9NSG6_9GLOM|nr:17676_t:CDS:2 [Cetraspora pellucida]
MPIYFNQPTQTDKDQKEKLIDEIKKVVKPGDKPSEVKKKVAEIKIKDSVGLERSQKLFNVLCDTWQKQHIYDNILKDLKLKDKDLYKVITSDITKLDIDVKTEHSKRNKKIITDPQTTDFSNIPYTPGEDMIGETYGRSQLVKQQKKDLKKLTTEETEGRRVSGEDGSIRYEPTYDKEVGDRDTDRTITVEGDRMFLGRLINIVEKLE